MCERAMRASGCSPTSMPCTASSCRASGLERGGPELRPRPLELLEEPVLEVGLGLPPELLTYALGGRCRVADVALLVGPIFDLKRGLCVPLDQPDGAVEASLRA